MRATILVTLLSCAGCGSVIEPGHRGLLFQPRRGGLQHEVLNPGYHRHGVYGRIDDFDITYSTRKEELHTVSSEGLALDVRVAVIYRPIVSELYELDTEVGPNYYDEVVGPEFRTAGRGVFARHSYRELQKNNEKIEDEIEEEMRRRIAGKHVEISSVVLEHVEYPQEILTVDRERLVGEQESIRQKAMAEHTAQMAKRALSDKAEQDRIRDEAEREAATRAAAKALAAKELEAKLAQGQAEIERARAESELKTRVLRAKAESEERRLLARAAVEEKKAEAHTVTPLMVMMHAYDALAKLGGSGTSIMLGDWSKVPSFLFPRELAGMRMGPVSGSAHAARATTATDGE